MKTRIVSMPVKMSSAPMQVLENIEYAYENESDTYEKLNLLNGLLLSPALDACFEAGYISFDVVGNIMISNELSANDLAAMGIHKNMKLSKIEPEHTFSCVS